MILSEAGIAQNEETKDEAKEGQPVKISKAEVMKILSKIDIFDKDSDDDDKLLTYVDYLDALVRVAAKYGFAQEDQEHERMEDRLTYIVEKLENKFADLKEPFKDYQTARNEQLRFPNKMVVNELEDGEGEYEEEGEDYGEY